jgi:hypothetical protein
MRSFRAADLQVGGGHLYATVVSYLQTALAPRVFGAATGGPGIFAVASALTEMAGWMAHDAGRDQSAEQHFVRALDLAAVASDAQLSAHILASMSHLALHQGRPAPAIQLARQGSEALSAGSASPGLAARLLAMEARVLIAQGEPEQACRIAAGRSAPQFGQAVAYQFGRQFLGGQAEPGTQVILGAADQAAGFDRAAGDDDFLVQPGALAAGDHDADVAGHGQRSQRVAGHDPGGDPAEQVPLAGRGGIGPQLGPEQPQARATGADPAAAPRPRSGNPGRTCPASRRAIAASARLGRRSASSWPGSAASAPA